jgi:hypothetical protein
MKSCCYRENGSSGIEMQIVRQKIFPARLDDATVPRLQVSVIILVIFNAKPKAANGVFSDYC